MHLLDALALTPTPDAPAVVALVGGGGKSSAMFALARELAAAGKRVVTTTTTRIAAAQIADAPAFVPVLDATAPLDLVARQLDAHRHVMLIGRETVEHGVVYKRAGIAPDVIDALLFNSPTPFSAWGVIAMWAIFASALLAIFQRRLPLRPRTWRMIHTFLAAVIVVGGVVHSVLIEGTMETWSKAGLCVLVLAATIKVITSLKVWTRRRAASPTSASGPG